MPEAVTFEVVGTATGIVGATLAARQNIWHWPLGLVMSIAFIYVFFDARLYSDMALHAVYVPVFIRGWVQWSRLTSDGEEVVVTSLTPRMLTLWVVSGAVASVGLGAGMSQWTDAALPFFDAGTTVYSLIALWLMGKKQLQAWQIWLFVDVTSIGIYAVTGLYTTILLRVAFLVIDAYGLRSWGKAMQRTAAGMPSGQ